MKLVLSQTILLATEIEIDETDKEAVRMIREAIAARDINKLSVPPSVAVGMVAIDDFDFYSISPN